MFTPIQSISRDGKASHGDDRTLAVEFYTYKELQTHETEQEGRLIYKDIPYIKIAVPGSKNVVDRAVRFDGDYNTPSDLERWPKQWERFQAGEKQREEGHLLAEMGLGEQEIINFKRYNIHTVEHLINVPDGLLGELGLGARGIREGARKWFKQKAQENARNVGYEARIAELEACVGKFAELQSYATQLEVKLKTFTKRQPSHKKGEK